MTVYTIEVRASAERYDILARQVAREILLLPGMHDWQGRLHQPLLVRTAQLYHLTGNLSPSQLDHLTNSLLIDPVTQIATISLPLSSPSENTIVDVFFHAGVTDTLAESVLMGASMLGIEGIERVETGRRYYLDGRLSADEVRSITGALLYNPVIQDYMLRDSSNEEGERRATARVPSQPPNLPRPYYERPPDSQGEARATARVPSQPPNLPRPYYERSQDPAEVIVRAGVERMQGGDPRGRPRPLSRDVPISGMSDDQLLELSKQGLLALNLDEMRVIQRHFREEGREPTDVELETLAQTWSEHCSHKTFKATIEYREVDTSGNVLEQETIEGLLKSYIMSATQQVARPWVVSAFSDNAGIVRFTETQDIAFKVETHNHPSAIEPFGGANTGVGGVIRDVLGVSAQPIACTDILCFGLPDTASEELPAGILTPRRIASGVVNGVRDYGNKMGIPTVNGAVLYHTGYIFNPLVFCGCLGILPHDSHPRRVQPGDRIVVLGGRTGRDGIHGATFSSGEMSSEINAQAGSAVQIGAPITEKKVADVVISARDRQLYSAITDCGAGGFSSAIGEMGAECGVYVELEKAPLKYQGLAPWEIWLSEAQERMVLAVPPQHLDDLLAICAIEEVEASIIGTFTNSQHLIVTYAGQTVADLPMSFLHDGRPDRMLEAVWIQESSINAEAKSPAPGAGDFASALILLLKHPTIASKESIVRRYDHEVQGATVLKPLVGRAGNGPGDAAILRPILFDVGTRFITSSPASASTSLSRAEADAMNRVPTPASSSHAGIILSNGVNPLYGQFDPYWMAMNAIDEALRNLTAVGGDIERAAILDNFCWGNPNDPAQLGMLVRAVKGCHDAAMGFGVPFISGKDSLNNEYRADGQRLPVIPTLLISALGVIDDAARSVDMSLKQPGNLLYLVGQTRNELAGSHYVEILTTRAGAIIPGTTVPHVNPATARTTMNAVGQAIRAGLVQSCHDLSEGGLAVAAAEMALAGLLGLSMNIEQVADEALEYQDDSRAVILLFSESASRFLVEIAPQQREAFEAHMRAYGVHDLVYLGSVTEDRRFEVHSGERLLIDLSVDELQAAWKGESA